MASDGARPACAWQLEPTVDRVLQAPGRRLHVQQSCGGCHGAGAFKAVGRRPILLLTSSGGNRATEQGERLAWLPMQTLLSSPASSIGPQAMLAPSSPLHRPIAERAQERRPGRRSRSPLTAPGRLVWSRRAAAGRLQVTVSFMKGRAGRISPPRLDCHRRGWTAAAAATHCRLRRQGSSPYLPPPATHFAQTGLELQYIHSRTVEPSVGAAPAGSHAAQAVGAAHPRCRPQGARRCVWRWAACCAFVAGKQH